LKKVLITGAAGLVGSVLRDGLKDDYELSGVDRVDIEGFECLVADTTDLDAVLPAYEGIDTVIDLASVPDDRTPWDIVHQNNLPSTYNALEASRRAGVKRMIFASSNHATGNYEDDHPYSAIVAGEYGGLGPDNIPYINTSMPVRPDGSYGIGKAFGEATGRHFSDRHGLSVICLRIGTLNRQSRPLSIRHFATLLTHRDLVHLVDRSIQAPPEIKFSIFYGVSNNKWRFWDISNSRDAIDYDPQDNAEEWRSE
jgi:uronate dehydrogenase